MSNNQPVDIYGKPYNRTLLVIVLLIGTFLYRFESDLIDDSFSYIDESFRYFSV